MSHTACHTEPAPVVAPAPIEPDDDIIQWGYHDDEEDDFDSLYNRREDE